MPIEMLPEMLELAAAGADAALRENATSATVAARLNAEMTYMVLTFECGALWVWIEVQARLGC